MILFHHKYEKMRAFEQERLGNETKALECGNLEDQLEKNDVLAMILSALITILPVALLFLCAIAAAGYFFIVR